MNNKRKSFVLLLTLIFITFSIGILYNIIKENKNNNKTNFFKQYYQSKIFLEDILIELKKNSKLINKNNFFYTIKTFPLKFNNEYYLIELKPYNQGININNIKENNFEYNLIYKILIRNNVKQPKYFLDILLDTIDKDSNERNYKTEIFLHKINFKQGYINSYDKMYQICKYYYLLTGDNNIFKIDWKLIISFFNVNNPKNYIYITIYFDNDNDNNNNNNYLKILYNLKTGQIKTKKINIIY